MSARLESIVFDAVDLRRQAEFWGAGLEASLLRDGSGEDFLRLEVGEDQHLTIYFEQVDHHQPLPHRLHLDLAGGPRQQAVVERFLRLGARHLDIGQRDVPWVVLADPERNAFCVMEDRPEYVDTGPIAALPIDAQDPDATAQFWVAASDWVDATGTRVSDQGHRILRHWSTRGPLLEFCPVDTPKVQKNPIHLDLRAEGDYDAELARLLSLGAHRLEHSWGELPRTVLLDPSGNEFCLLR